MQTMELVDIEDVYPYQEGDVRMNPRDVESKECREYIAQLAEQFRYNKLNPGQPRVRPILYRDGGIYQIVDGECRYWAMRSIGTKRFYADVFDDLEDAETARREAAKAMVETDAKRALTPEEMSRGVQTMLALDVPDEEVAAVARVDADCVRRARRGARSVSDAAYDMTLDRLMAIADFDGTAEGDAEAVAELRDCRQAEWRAVYARRSADRKRAQAIAAVRSECARLGVPEYVEEPDGTAHVASVYINEDAPGKVAGAVEDVEGAVILIDVPWVEILRPATDEDLAQEEERRAEADEANRERDRQREMWAQEVEARDAWVASRLGDLRSMRSTAALLADRAMAAASDLIERTGAEVNFAPTPALVAAEWCRSWTPCDTDAVNAALGGKPYTGQRPEIVAGYAELADAMAADGYEPNATGAAVIAWTRREADRG